MSKKPNDLTPDPSGPTTVDTQYQAVQSLQSLCGTVLDDRYQLDELIGLGGMGGVFRARQLRLRRTVAIKVPKPELASNPDFLGRFEREALSMAKVVHENIVQIFDVFVSNDPQVPSFIAMEYVEGFELEPFLREQQHQLTVEAVLELFMQIARGLDAAHDRGIVHRDIKPSNIVITMPQRVAKIMDFGVARVEMENVFTTQDAAAIGTPAFMAPEQVRGKPTSPAADVYAYGMMLYRLLTRRIAFDAPNTSALLFAQVQENPVPIADRNPRLPPAVQTALAPALEKDPLKRPRRASEVARHMAQALEPLKSESFASLFEPSDATMPAVPGTRTAAKGRPLRLTLPMLIGAALLLGLMLAATLTVVLLQARDHFKKRPAQIAQAAIATEPAPQPETAIVLPTQTPAPTPEPTPQPTPTQTQRPTVTTPTPIATEQPPAPTAPVKAIAPATTPTSPEPAPEPTDPYDDPAIWDPELAPPGLSTYDRSRASRDITRYIDQEMERPLKMAAPRESALNDIDSELADALVRATEKLSANYHALIVSLRPIKEERLIWKDRAEFKLTIRIQGRPYNIADPTYRKTVYTSEEPATGRFVLEEGQWRLHSLEGNADQINEIINEEDE